MATFGERLKELRQKKNITQGELAEDLGINKQTISDYERGVRRPAGENSLETYENIADYFNVDLMYLLGHSDTITRISGSELDPADGSPVTVTPEERELLRRLRDSGSRYARLLSIALKLIEEASK